MAITVELPLNQVILGDCTEVMADWPDDSVDCIVTDPPYGISFMGKEWDKALPPSAAFEQMIRVLKPGALAFVMSSPRQDVLWRMLAMLEGVGFHLRQSFISWIFKTGFPKALDVSKGIDRKLGLERSKVTKFAENFRGGKLHAKDSSKRSWIEVQSDDAISELASKWEGWKSQTGLKPAAECVLMVNKPRSEKTIVDNVMKHGVGAINVDACRIPFKNKEDSDYVEGKHDSVEGIPRTGGNVYQWKEYQGERTNGYTPKGRFPANLLISDGSLDTGKTTKSEGGKTVRGKQDKVGKWGFQDFNMQGYGDIGDQSRYFDLDAWAKHHGFLDVAKPSKAERDLGLTTQPLMVPKSKFNLSDGSKDMRFDGVIPNKRRNVHPTVKPVKLMAYLIELGCPKDGVVVDPFVGSGTTCIAAKQLRRKWIGIEIKPEYADIARARIEIKGPLDKYIKPS